jgi:hypothetical protein
MKAFPGMFLSFFSPIHFTYTLPLTHTHTHTGPPRLTSQVCDRRLTEAVLRPITIAKKEFRFLCALQLWNKGEGGHIEETFFQPK